MEDLKSTVTSVTGRNSALHDGTARGGGAGGEDTDAFSLDEPGPTVILFRQDLHVVSSILRQVRLTALTDRVEEIEAIRQLALSEDVRLLTLVGPAGVEKTRRALEAGHQVVETFPDGVALVDLTSIRDPNQVLPALARAHSIRDTENSPLLERLGEYLGDHQALLVLDNYEHVLTAAPQLGELLARCPGITLRVTSREPLHLQWEHIIRVRHREGPDPQHLPSTEKFPRFLRSHFSCSTSKQSTRGSPSPSRMPQLVLSYVWASTACPLPSSSLLPAYASSLPR